MKSQTTAAIAALILLASCGPHTPPIDPITRLQLKDREECTKVADQHALTYEACMQQRAAYRAAAMDAPPPGPDPALTGAAQWLGTIR
jgi:hypothetical protein